MKYGILITFYCVASTAFGQIGSRIAALGNNFTALRDEWNGANNPSAVSISSIQIAINYQYDLEDWGITTQAALINIPFKERNILSFSASKFGNDIYNNSNLNIAFARSFKNFNLGISVAQSATIVPHHIHQRSYNFNFGSLYQFNKQWAFGISFNNLSISNLSQVRQHPIRTHLGITYQPTDKVLATTSFKIDKDLNKQFSGGIEYIVHPKIALRMGINTFPFTHHYGLGLTHKNFRLNNSIRHHNQLGIQHQIEIRYAF